MSPWEKAGAAATVIAGIGALVCVVAWWWTGRRASTSEREAVQDAPRVRPAGCCLPAAASAGVEHDPWCHRRPAVGRAVVAGSDLEWQADLARFYADYDAYRFDCRLPGERAS